MERNSVAPNAALVGEVAEDATTVAEECGAPGRVVHAIARKMCLEGLASMGALGRGAMIETPFDTVADEQMHALAGQGLGVPCAAPGVPAVHGAFGGLAEPEPLEVAQSSGTPSASRLAGRTG